MSRVIYATFADPKNGKRAVGALLDHGVANEDISLAVNEQYASANPNFMKEDDHDDKADASAKHGITTTTGADASAGAAKGAGAGAVLGILGAVASLIIPGFGIVIGGGALATALAAAAGTAVAGAVAGGVTGYLKDQGVPETDARRYEEAVTGGGALLSVNAPSGKVDVAEIQEILAKYGAENHNAYAQATTVTTTVVNP